MSLRICRFLFCFIFILPNTLRSESVTIVDAPVHPSFPPQRTLQDRFLRFAKQFEYQLRALPSCREFISNDDIGTQFKTWADAYPDRVVAFTIGTTVEGRPIHALRISKNVRDEEAEPEARIIGGIHGNECMAAQTVLTTATWLIEDYEKGEPFATRLIDQASLTMVPLINPDGYTGDTAYRENANEVDLNRNLHFAWVGEGPHPFSEPETLALRDLSEANNFVLGISYHTVARYVNGPWNYTPHHPPDENLIDAIGAAYAGSSDFDVVFGWDWYDIEGDVNDWSLGTGGTFDWTLELMSDRDPQWGINQDGIEGLLSYLFQGIGGIVTDDETGDPLFARIDLLPEGVPVFTDPDVGDFHRILLPGTYDIRVSAPGYASQTITNLQVGKDEITPANISLVRDDGLKRFAEKVVGMTLPKRITTHHYSSETYLNRTLAWHALGAPDGRPYSLSAFPDKLDIDPADIGRVVGSITLDMGADTPVPNRPGVDFEVVSATNSSDEAAVSVATDALGPYTEVARGSGTLSIDFGAIGVESIRYVRIVDLNQGPFESAFSGYDVDAVVVPPPIDETVDTDAAGDRTIAVSGGFTCRTAPPKPSTFRWLFDFLLGE